MDSCDLLVVGGGPAGAATAAHASRAGLGVIVVERARFPRHKACAEYLSPEAARDLEALGVLGAVERAAARLDGFRLVADDGREATGRFRGAAAAAPCRSYGLALPRAELDPLLLTAARETGADVREQTACESLVIERGGVRGAVVRSGKRRDTIRARAVAGADGLNSLVARQLGLARSGRPRRLALAAHLAGVTAMKDVGEMFAGPGWYVGLAPLGGGLVNAAMVVPLSESRLIARDPRRYFLHRLAGVPELARRIAGARVARRVMITGPFARRAARATADGALLVGDAADFFDPFTGEGIFAALRGGALAAEAVVAALRTGPPTRASLRSYELARRRAFAGKWVLERVVGLAAVQPWLMRRFTGRLAERADLADLWVGAAGDSVPVSRLFSLRNLAALLISPVPAHAG